MLPTHAVFDECLEDFCFRFIFLRMSRGFMLRTHIVDECLEDFCIRKLFLTNVIRFSVSEAYFSNVFRISASKAYFSRMSRGFLLPKQIFTNVSRIAASTELCLRCRKASGAPGARMW